MLHLVDIYEPVDPITKKIVVVAQGNRSLSARNMETPGTEKLQSVVDQLKGSCLHKKLVDDHIETEKRGCYTSMETLNQMNPIEPTLVKIDYLVTRAFVSDQSGRTFTLHYAYLL